MNERIGAGEAGLEQFALDELADMEWQPLAGVEVAPGSVRGRVSWDELVLPARMLEKMRALNPQVPQEYLEQARGAILAPESLDPIAENYRIHEILVKGYRGISYVDHQGVEQNPTIRLVGPKVEDNELLAVNQVTIRSRDVERRFDVVLYLNGMPVVIMELKSPESKNADLAAAHAQLATYLREFPMAFRFAVLTVVSDGATAKYGTPFTPFNHFAPWNVDDDGKILEVGQAIDDQHTGMALEHLIDGVLQSERFLQMQRNFVAFDRTSDGLVKRIAKPHQYFAVTKAVGCTVTAVERDGKAGVVWHTQGSGKSMEMELYANLVAKQPRLKNPTLVVVTDRTELDGQLYRTFERSLLLPERPVQIESRAELRAALADRTTGGIYFTTLQKFGLSDEERKSGLDHPLLTARDNVIVIVDEAHRSHYDEVDGFAAHLNAALPSATAIAFTGTPISFLGRDTRKVFGDYIDIYDLTRAVRDGATVRVVFEPRLPELKVADGVSDADIDAAADEAVVGLDDIQRARIEKSATVLNALYGAPQRLEAVAKDIVEHWDTRSAAMREFIGGPGKALIVCATREICANLYEQIVALRREWEAEAITEGKIKVLYSGDAKDKPPIAKHVRREGDNKKIQNRLKNAADPLELVIVQNKLLTGFDAPSLHTLYLDRPMKGALLMQTLARVNRTFAGKQDGLVVAYAPLAENLEQALAEYTVSDREHRPVGRNTDEFVVVTRELIEALDRLCAGYPWQSKLGPGPKQWFTVVTGLVNHLRAPSTPGNRVAPGEPTLADRFRTLANELARAWAIASGSRTLAELLPKVKFYEAVRVWMVKCDAEQRKAEGGSVPTDVQRLLDQLLVESTASGRIIDIYEAAGMPKPSLTDLTPEFEARTQEADNPHLAIEALRDLLTQEVARSTRGNLVRNKAFSERIRELMNRYTNQQLTSAEVISELIALAKEAAAERERGKLFTPALDEDELAFYDSIHENESAVLEMGDDILGQIARDLVQIMRRDTRTDWTVRDDVRAKLRSTIKRLLIKYKYPPDKQPAAIRQVLDQMEVLAPKYAEERRAGVA